MPTHSSRQSRSLSPHREKHRSTRHRSRSPRPATTNRSHHRSRSPRHKRKRTPPPSAPVRLPFNSQKLHKHDAEAYRPVFGLYLDVQKQILLDELDERELRGRWKRFVHHWNRGELAEGWYDPSTKQRADQATADAPAPSRKRRDSPDYKGGVTQQQEEEASSDDDFVGPALPGREDKKKKPGPAPASTLQDLRYSKEQAEENEHAARLAAREDRKAEWKSDRTLQKERLDELAPRADPGSRERKLEKKREVGSTLASFAEAKTAGIEEVGERDLMGEDEDELHRLKKRGERIKTEREVRKEEMLAERALDLEERRTAMKEKEEKTMEMLRDLAKKRFG